LEGVGPGPAFELSGVPVVLRRSADCLFTLRDLNQAMRRVWKKVLLG
jgi:hypothetical protein